MTLLTLTPLFPRMASIIDCCIIRVRWGVAMDRRSMPIYEYQCEACGHRLEKLQKINDKPLTVCHVCGASELKKLVSAVSFRLKGTGWYETDFKTGKKKNISGGGEDKSSGTSSDYATTDTMNNSKDDNKSSSTSAAN